MSTNTMQYTQTNSNNETRSKVTRQFSRLMIPGLHIAAIILLLASTILPYWSMVLEAPQYPGGLQMRVFVNYVTGDEDETLDDVREIDGLNHYIGMKSLYDAAQLERMIAIPALAIMSILVLIAAFWKSRWAWLLTIPMIGFPFVYLADLAFWLNHYGQNLDPYAPLSSAIKPFTPPILGEGVIGNFKTVASIEPGWMIAVAGSVLLVVALVVRFMNRRQQNEQTT